MNIHSNSVLEESRRLLKRYREAPSRALRDDLVLRYMYIPKMVASSLRPTTLNLTQLEDMVNQGVISLIRAIDEFDPNRTYSFESYAYTKIRCAVIDYIRKQDWLPRRVRKTAMQVDLVNANLTSQLGRDPTIEEIAEALGVPTYVVQRNRSEILSSVAVSYEQILEGSMHELVSEDATGDPQAQLFSKELTYQISTAIDKLSERERLVISLYYYEHLRLTEIAEVMNISESRVSQIHKAALIHLKDLLENYVKD